VSVQSASVNFGGEGAKSFVLDEQILNHLEALGYGQCAPLFWGAWDLFV
jgi:hypothetical protein